MLAGHVIGSRTVGQTGSLSVLSVQIVDAFKRFDFIVTQVATHELEFNEAHLVKEIVVVVVGLVQH